MPEDLARYVKDGFQLVTEAHTAKLEVVVKEIEAQKISFRGWATPGQTLESAALDVARTTCRRAERKIATLAEAGGTENANILIFLNRLSDLLWLMARWVETNDPASSSASASD